MLCLLGIMLSCSDDPKTESSKPEPSKSEEQVPLDPFIEHSKAVLKKKTVEEAFQYSKNYLRTDKDGTLGARIFASWSNKMMQWSDVKIVKNETNIGMIKKDFEAEAGKRICVNGTITSIKKDKELGFVGSLKTKDSEEIDYYASGSTGQLIQNSKGQLCGMVAGMSNEDKIIFVGMFSIPENTGEEATQNVITEKPLFEIAVSKCEDTLYNDGGEMIGVFQIDLSVKNLSDKKLDESLFSFNVLDTAGEPLGNGGCFVKRLRPGKTTRKQVILGTYPESWWKNFCDPNSGKMTLELSEVSCKFEGDMRNEDCFDRVKVKKGKLPIHR